MQRAHHRKDGVSHVRAMASHKRGWACNIQQTKSFLCFLVSVWWLFNPFVVMYTFLLIHWAAARDGNSETKFETARRGSDCFLGNCKHTQREISPWFEPLGYPLLVSLPTPISRHYRVIYYETSSRRPSIDIIILLPLILDTLRELFYLEGNRNRVASHWRMTTCWNLSRLLYIDTPRDDSRSWLAGRSRCVKSTPKNGRTLTR